jgi:hypothetical protein
MLLLRILIFKELSARRLYMPFGVKGLQNVIKRVCVSGWRGIGVTLECVCA